MELTTNQEIYIERMHFSIPFQIPVLYKKNWDQIIYGIKYFVNMIFFNATTKERMVTRSMNYFTVQE